MNYAQEIKERIKMPDMVRFYGFEINRQNRMACPFHGGVNPNLGIKEDFCHCFKCGYKGDVIKFVQDYFGISFQEALLKLNDDFVLGMQIGGKTDKRTQIAKAKEAFLQKNERKRRQEAADRAKTKYFEAVAEFDRLEKNLLKHAPNGSNNIDEIHPLYLEAVKNIEAAKYNIFCAEEEWKNELAKSAD